jgi:hypothetical protein
MIKKYSDYVKENLFNYDIDPFGEENWEELSIGDNVVCINNDPFLIINILQNNFELARSENLKESIKKAMNAVMKIYSHLEIGKTYIIEDIRISNKDTTLKLKGLDYCYPERLFKKSENFYSL